MGDLASRAAALREHASSLAGSLSSTASGETTLACERAILRLFGVAGLDGRGRPLAGEVVERLAALGPGRLGGGIALPFAVAAREYDLDARQLALDIAAGDVDLGLEAELLGDPARRAEAEATINGWLGDAWDRFEANRTARAELMDVLGEPAAPWLGIDLPAAPAGLAAAVAADAVARGASSIRVRVPPDRELRRRLGEELDVDDSGADPLLAPAGSQRGIGVLRSVIDEAAAARGGYVRLATRAIGLAAPDQAVVAGFERVDLVFADPLETVVEFGVEPGRAIADHIFAVRLLVLAGADLVLGSGPLAVAPELARGEPLEAATRIGRGIALQALSVELSRDAGLPDARILIGALSREHLSAPMAIEPGIVEIALRRAVFPAFALVIDEPESEDADAAWPVALPAWNLDDRLAAVFRRPVAADIGSAAHEVRQAAAASAASAAARDAGPLRGPAAELADRSLAIAEATLGELAAEGWDRLLLSPAALARRSDPTSGWIGGAGRVPRREDVDIFRSVDVNRGAP